MFQCEFNTHSMFPLVRHALSVNQMHTSYKRRGRWKGPFKTLPGQSADISAIPKGVARLNQPSTERRTPLVSQLLKGHVDLAHAHALPLVGRLAPVLAHRGRDS